MTLTPEFIRSLDPGGMGAAIAGMGGDFLAAAERTEAGLSVLKLPEKLQISNIVLAGLGGSAIGGDLVRSYLASAMAMPFVVNRTYRLPAFVGERTLVIVSSYSGTTEETLAMYEAARARGAQIVCLSTGGTLKELAAKNGNPFIELPTGYQPRAALAHSFVPVLMILEHVGLCAPQRAHIKEAAEMLNKYTANYGTNNLSNTNDAISLANLLASKIPVVYSDCELLDTVNLRWRGQIQENAKHVAFGNLLPEMNHNEINGWAHPAGRQSEFIVIFLRSPEDEHPRVAERFDILREVLASKKVAIEERCAAGGSPLARMFSLIALGDWTSYYVALLESEDPSPVPVIQLLKAKLAG
ncbi:MAG TPA: bifunctional phosphoglucose/phosphomannose isomerase [Candidatus Kapabacteria bacterium]|nr:bifunctional phosphoglucose/phosphomannose isomerase [Candidatus Kapabacteria bacterium]